MNTQTPDPIWYEKFFSGAALDLWRRSNSLETTEDEANFLHEVLAAPAEGKLLDVPCGNGRLSFPLATLGYQLTGVDTCKEFLDEAEKSAKTHKIKMDFVNGDMRTLKWQHEFDGAFCMGNSFGYFDHSGVQQFVQAVHTSLRPRARFVIASDMIAESFLVNASEREWVKVEDIYMLVENRYNTRLSCVETTYTFLRDGRKEEQREAVNWIYTSGELCRMMETAGFTIENMFSSTEGEPFEIGSGRLFLIAQA